MLPEQAAARAARRGGRARDPRRPPATAGSRRPTFEAHRAVRPRRRRVDRHRPEGDVHLRGRRRALADAAPRGHRAGRAAPTSSTACTSCRQPVKLWYLSSLLPPGEARRPGASASSGRSAPRRSAPTTRRSTPSRSCCCTTLLDELGVARACALRLGSLGTPETRARLPRAAHRATCAPTRTELSRGRPRADRPQPAARVRRRPPRHARGDGRRAAAARPPRRRGRRALRRGPRAPRRAPGSPTRSTRRSCAAWTTTRARSSSSPPTRSARSRASAAAGATTAWSSSSAAPPTPGHAAGPPGVERMLLAGERSARGRRRRAATSTSRGTAPACDAFALAAEARRAGLDVQLELGGPLAQGPAQAGRPRRRPLRCHLRRRRRPAAATWTRGEQEDAGARDGRRRPRPARDGTSVKRHRAPTRYRDAWAGELRRRARRRRGRASPAGCTAAATTAG